MSVNVKRDKFVARVRFEGEMFYIGTFGSEEAARAASDAEIGRIREGVSLLAETRGTLSLLAYAARIQVRAGTVKRWRHEGMPALMIGEFVRVRPDEADAWVKEHHAASVAFGRSSVVYVARRDTDSAIKIGWTSDVERRMKELRKEGGSVVLLAVLPGDKPDELRLHEQFAAHRLDGEWFAVAAENVVAALRGAA